MAQVLDLSRNCFSDINRCSELLPVSLQHLSFSHNLLPSLQGLTFVAGLDRLTQLNISHNPFTLHTAKARYGQHLLQAFKMFLSMSF